MTITQDIIQQAWRKKNALFYWVLVPLSWLFAAITSIRRCAYRAGFFRSYALPVPVIIVGNIHIGGSGKTPVVIWLVNQLKQQGYKPAVISRGYGGSVKLPTAVTINSDANIIGDEPLLIANRCECPVWVGADRVRVGVELLKAHPDCDVIISDDGLQHYRLKRDVEIVVVDAENYQQDACLLPAGRLRESMDRLQTVDAVIKNGYGDAQVNQPSTITNAFQMQLKGEQFYNLAEPTLKASALDFKRKSIKAMAGIGNPARFFEHLRQLGLTFASSSFDDHHAYNGLELAKMDCDVLLMTEKDAVKCQLFAKPHYWVLPVEASIDEGLLPIILNKLTKRTAV